MDHRYVKIVKIVVGVPMMIMLVLSVLGTFLLSLPLSDIAIGLARVGFWLVCSAFIGSAIWFLFGNLIPSQEGPSRAPAVAGTIVMAVLPVVSFLLFSETVFDYLGGATFLYLAYLWSSPCLLCITAPMAWRFYDPKKEMVRT